MPELLKSITIPQADGTTTEVVVNDNSEVLDKIQSVENRLVGLQSVIASGHNTISKAVNDHAEESRADHAEIKSSLEVAVILSSLSVIANRDNAQVWVGTYQEYLQQSRSLSDGFILYAIY